MSVGNNLQKMENIEENAVTKGAKPAETMQKLSTGGTPATWEDLGGPTPENYKSDDDSAKLKTPGATLKQVKDVVNKGAKPAEPMKGISAGEALKSGDEVELEDNQEVVAEEPATEEVTTEETVEEKIDIEADVNALLGGEELSEEFREKAKTVFEAALNSKVAELKEDLQAKYDEKLAEEVESSKAALAERVDQYLESVSYTHLTLPTKA